jgi:hypothetical protein
MALVLVALPLAIGQESSADPTVEISYPRFEFPDKGCDVSMRHFRNSPAYLLEGTSVSESVNLRNGSFERRQAGNTNPQPVLGSAPTAEDQHIAIVAYLAEYSSSRFAYF